MMKVIITDLVRDEETIVPLYIPYIANTPEEEENMRNTRERTIDKIISAVYKVAFDKHTHPNVFEVDMCTLTRTSKQVFILSPNADMVREEEINEYPALSHG